MIKLMSILSIIFLSSSHPVAHIICLIIMSMIILSLISLSMKSSWLGLVFALLMMGGLLILFIYMVSLASNEEFTMNKAWIISWPIVFLSSSMGMFSFDPSKLNKIFTSLSLWNSILCISYLLLSLLIVIEIIQNYKSALRSSN